MPACQSGYRRLQVCVRDDLYRALVLIEASEVFVGTGLLRMHSRHTWAVATVGLVGIG